MRKLLLSSRALATAAIFTANVAVADVSISAGTEWKYMSTNSQVTAEDGTEFSQDSEIAFKFSNKTDSCLTIGYVAELESDADGTTTMDESSISISGKFGKIVLGQNDGVSDQFVLNGQDMVAEESALVLASATIATNSDISLDQTDDNKISYFLTAMGDFTTGISFEDSGQTGTFDMTSYGVKYLAAAAGNTVNIGGATITEDNATLDKDSQNVYAKVVSGNLSFVLSQNSTEASDEDINATGARVSYKMANCMVVGAYTVKSEDDLDAGEEYSASGVEVQYTIAAGLTAVINVDDYDYKIRTNNDSADTVADSGTISKLTLKASF
ncbi:porin [Alphaproteobacteria bacterium]|nr:porin [Alphaproteobacteria bacterium]